MHWRDITPEHHGLLVEVIDPRPKDMRGIHDQHKPSRTVGVVHSENEEYPPQLMVDIFYESPREFFVVEMID